MAYIYKITNKINNKIYIGKTLKTIEERWKEHCKDYKKDSEEKRPLYSAMKKYGIENFKIEEIEKCNINIVNEREKYWIEYYSSFKNGYNATKGGDGKAYADYDLIYSLWKENKNMLEIQNILGYSIDTIRIALENNNVTERERKERGIQSYSKSIAMLDKETEEILNVFSSQEEALRFLNKGSGGHIAQVCKGKRKTAYGFKWRYI